MTVYQYVKVSYSMTRLTVIYLNIYIIIIKKQKYEFRELYIYIYVIYNRNFLGMRRVLSVLCSAISINLPSFISLPTLYFNSKPTA